MIKHSRDQRFYWLEPIAFARARARTAPSGTRARLQGLGILSAMLALMFVFIHMPSTLRDLGLIVLFSVGGALFIVYAVMLIVAWVPNDIMVASDRIVLGKDVIPFENIKSAIVGTTSIDGSILPMLSFSTKDGRSYCYGLGRKVEPGLLADHLESAGVEVL